MIEDIFEGLFKLIGRFLAQIFIELFLEILIKGPGYFICKLFMKGDPDPEGFMVVFTGILFWLVIGFGFYGLFANTSDP